MPRCVWWVGESREESNNSNCFCTDLGGDPNALKYLHSADAALLLSLLLDDRGTSCTSLTPRGMRCERLTCGTRRSGHWWGAASRAATTAAAPPAPRSCSTRPGMSCWTGACCCFVVAAAVTLPCSSARWAICYLIRLCLLLACLFLRSEQGGAVRLHRHGGTAPDLAVRHRHGGGRCVCGCCCAGATALG